MIPWYLNETTSSEQFFEGIKSEQNNDIPGIHPHPETHTCQSVEWSVIWQRTATCLNETQNFTNKFLKYESQMIVTFYTPQFNLISVTDTW